MIKPQRLVTANSVLWETNRMKDLGQDYVKQSAEWTGDTRKKERKAKLECKTCFYFLSFRAGCAAVTTYPCGLCGETQSSGSSVTDVLCKECASKYELCKYCGGDAELRVRRFPILPSPIKMFPCSMCDNFFKEIEIHGGHYYCERHCPRPVEDIK